jgi:anaerobic magnesium-protoporphyrin IX monomethyl ester cyclase
MENKKSLDCLLVFPPFEFPTGFYTKQRSFDPPLSLMALAAYVRQYNFSCQIMDTNILFAQPDFNFEEYFIEHYVKQYTNIDVIGFTTYTPSIKATFKLAQICKKYFPDTEIVLGGAHASFVPDESLSKPYVDAVVMGEGEETLLELLLKRPKAEILGLAYKINDGGSLVYQRNKHRYRLKKLDELPFPAYDMIDMKMYRPIHGNYKRLPAMMMVSSRGCPWSCNFCRRPVGKMWTYRSAQSLYDEFKLLSVQYGIKDIAIMDDVFTVSKERVMEFCNLLIKNPIDIQWLCFARVDIVDEEMLQTMKKAGCWQVMYGIENFNPEILNDINKGVDIEQIFNGIKWTKKAGLEIRICMMVGNVGDTKEIVHKNIQLLNKLDPDYISVAILTPFPGHDIYNWALEEGRIASFDWNKYYGSLPIMKIDTMSPEEIVDAFRQMTFKFYFRPSFILRKLLSIRTFTELKTNVMGAYGLLKFMIEKVTGASKSVYLPPHLRLTECETSDIDEIIANTKTATKQTAIS